MPSRKQRRRRAKGRRHEYEYVYVDEEGREVEAEEAEALTPSAPARSRLGSSVARAANGRGARSAGGRATPARKVDPPSWRRAVKRSLIFAPFMFLTLYLLDRRLSVESRVLVTVEMLVFFIPFSYLVDRTMYRRLNRPAGTEKAPRTRRREAKS
jgi:hypothetical protein